jgi:RimJ/RimL family protein N-acetyltransferase
MISIRRATANDSADLLAWRNDERTRLASVSQEPVSAEDHEGWLSRSLASRDRVLYIGTLPNASGADQSVGMCRFDLADGGTAEVSINLNPSFRGRGLAAQLLARAIESLEESGEAPTRLTATIRSENAASTRIFIGCGFTEVRRDDDYVYFERTTR